MIEIGKTRIVHVRKRDKATHKLVPQFDEQDNPITKIIAREIWAVTKKTLDGHFCRDSGRKLVVGLVDGDLLTLYPKGTRQKVSVKLSTVYSFCLRSAALSSQLEKARKRKEAKTRQRQNRRIQYAEQKLRLWRRA